MAGFKSHLFSFIPCCLACYLSFSIQRVNSELATLVESKFLFFTSNLEQEIVWDNFVAQLSFYPFQQAGGEGPHQQYTGQYSFDLIITSQLMHCFQQMPTHFSLTVTFFINCLAEQRDPSL